MPADGIWGVCPPWQCHSRFHGLPCVKCYLQLANDPAVRHLLSEKCGRQNTPHMRPPPTASGLVAEPLTLTESHQGPVSEDPVEQLLLLRHEHQQLVGELHRCQNRLRQALADRAAERSGRLAAEAAARSSAAECVSWRRLGQQLPVEIEQQAKKQIEQQAKKLLPAVTAADQSSNGSVAGWLTGLGLPPDAADEVLRVFDELLGDELQLWELGPSVLDDEAVKEVRSC